MRKAVIDIGTNTFHLLIADIEKEKVEFIFKKTIAVKLGEGGGISKGEILKTAYSRGIKALQEFKIDIDKFSVNKIKATATAATRDAKNGPNFINDVYKLTEITIDIINGAQEAEYIYYGAKASGILTEQVSLIMDIGGGSVEFIIGNNNNIFWKESFRIGAARLLSDFYEDKRLNINDILNIENHLENTLTSLKYSLEKYQPKILIGTAGAFDSYRDLLLEEVNLDFKDALFNLPKTDFENLLQKIIKSNHAERVAMKGLIPLRYDMILMAAILTHFIIKISKINKFVACSYSLKEGLIYS